MSIYCRIDEVLATETFSFFDCVLYRHCLTNSQKVHNCHSMYGRGHSNAKVWGLSFFREFGSPTFFTSVDALPPPLARSPTHLFTLDFTSPHHYRVPTSLVSTFFPDFKVISLSTRSLVGLLISSCLDALPVPLESRTTSPIHRTLYSTCPSLVMSS